MRVFLSFFRNSFFLNRHNFYPLAAAAVFNSVLWATVLIKIHGGNKPIPLRYNVLSGIAFVGPASLFLQLPFIGLLLLLCNMLLGRLVYAREKFLGTFLCYVSLIIQIILAIAIASLIVLNS